MADVFHEIGSDLVNSANGDLLLADGLTLSQQRVLRRLITNLKDYIWYPEYGGGLPAKVGQPTDSETIQSLITAQMFLEDSVVQSPPPTIAVTPVPAGLFVEIQYFDSETGEPVALSFTA